MPRDKNIFTLNPTSLDMKRSVFSRNSQHKTSFNEGSIIPIYLDEVLPGDTVSMDLAQVIRMSTPIAPIMDNLYCDVYFFFVPNRLVWSHWQQFCGENDTTAWTSSSTYTIPMTDVGQSSDRITIGDIGDYFGLPVKNGTGTGSVDDSAYGAIPNTMLVSELPLRAYFKIYNDWFRDENSIAPKIYSIGDTKNTAIRYTNAPMKASRFHDLFSSALPAPQKGGAVSIPLGTTAPVIGVDGTGTRNADKFSFVTSQDSSNSFVGVYKYKGTDYVGFSDAQVDSLSQHVMRPTASPAPGSTPSNTAVGTSQLVADLTNATAATINSLRVAFQVQKLLEKDARGGTRYIELLKAHFGVTSPDARLQRSEYLCGHRFRINVDQVVAHAETGSNQGERLGNTGAVSKTTQAGSMFTKSFVEHGMLIGLCVIRQDHTYSQGLDKYWLKKDRFDFYYPVLANIGEVPVYKSEIDARIGASGTVGEASGVFGYQEAWYEYRFKPSRCSAYLNPIVRNSLNYWTLGDAYASVPGLNQTFLEEGPAFLDRALQVQSSTMHQFIADFYFKAKYSRVMPLYSVPGLIDHH